MGGELVAVRVVGENLDRGRQEIVDAADFERVLFSGLENPFEKGGPHAVAEFDAMEPEAENFLDHREPGFVPRGVPAGGERGSHPEKAEG
jgi:hypothetical protein